jgi:hypothetical protein
MDWRLPGLFSTVLVVLGGCRTEGTQSDRQSADPVAIQVAMFALMADSADHDLRRNSQPPRPYCLRFEGTDHKDPPSETMSGIRATGREVYPGSQCDSVGQATPVTTLWFAPVDSVTLNLVAGGFVLGGTWGRGYECSVDAAGEQISLTDCRLIEIY